MNWKNIPIPETIVIPLLVGITFELIFPQRILEPTIITGIIGIIIGSIGLILIVWSVYVAGSTDMASIGELITTGPYARSRNPMYLGWIFIFVSVMACLNSLWILLLFPVALAVTHFVAILPEERKLEREFGDQYSMYCEQVRRYL